MGCKGEGSDMKRIAFAFRRFPITHYPLTYLPLFTIYYEDLLPFVSLKQQRRIRAAKTKTV